MLFSSLVWLEAFFFPKDILALSYAFILTSLCKSGFEFISYIQLIKNNKKFM